MSYFDNFGHFNNMGTSREGYEAAQVCLNGHPINHFAETMPQHNAKCCPTCGAETTMVCAGCGQGIRGYYHSQGLDYGEEYKPPAFCHNCEQQILDGVGCETAQLRQVFLHAEYRN